MHRGSPDHQGGDYGQHDDYEDEDEEMDVDHQHYPHHQILINDCIRSVVVLLNFGGLVLTAETIKDML